MLGSGDTIHFQFKSKGGKRQAIDITDPRIARVVRKCRDLPGYGLFQYRDERGQLRDIKASDVNAYLKDISGQNITAKDFRTWAGTVLAAMALQDSEPVPSPAHRKRNVVRAVVRVAQALGNTPAICRKSYIHPAVIDAYLQGDTLPRPRRRADRPHAQRPAGLRPDEAAVLGFLQHRSHRDARRHLATAA